MAVQALYLRWRPMTFEDVVGQEHVTYTLQNALASGRVGHAYLFSGPRGTGKTTMARLLAKAVNCLNEDPARRPDNTCPHCIAVNEGRFLDLIEIDAASHTGVDDVRELRDRIAFSPNEGEYKVYIIDEVHRFSGAAFDALLKTIEEPPAHAIFVLATTEIHKVPQTIKSRCQRFDFRKLALHEIVGRLAAIVENEGLQAEPAALELVARQATGSMRDAISLLDQLISGPDAVLNLDLAQAILGTAANQDVRSLTDAILMANIADGLNLINYALDQGADPRQFARQMVEYLRLVMLAQTGGPAMVEAEVSQEALDYVVAHANDLPRRALLAAIKAFNEAATDASSGWQPQLPLEMALIESVEALYEPEPMTRQAAPAPSATPRQAAPQQSAEESAPNASQPIQTQTDEPIYDTGEPVLEMAKVSHGWNRVLGTVHQMDLTVEALLKSGKLYGVEGTTIIYQMPSDILRDKMEADANVEIIEAAIKHVYGVDLKFRCRIAAAGVDNSQSNAVDDLIASDDAISFAVNELGGKVTNIEETEE